MVLLVVLVVTLALPAAPGAAQSEGPQNPVYLPLVFNNRPANPVHSGVATYYYATGAGSCGYPASPGDLMVAAMNADQYDGSAACGAYVLVHGPKGSVTVRIVDLCPGCDAGHLDLSEQAFARIADLPRGRVPITWQVISPDLPGPIAYYFNASSNPWWMAVQIRNHRNPVAKLEYFSNGQWIELPRQSWNYFIRPGDERNDGPYTFRVTDANGNTLVDSNIPFRPGETINGGSQFPP